MSLNRIYLSEQVDLKLRSLKSRTGLTPNLLCRLGFSLSLNEAGVPDMGLYSEGQSREFNRYTLVGQWDSLVFALLRERLAEDGLSETDLETQFRAHLNRGVMLLSQRVKNLDDILKLMATSAPSQP
ncbi:MAG: DNA sulfur modification protein DndE [Blastocatellia bacterium]|nr:DNA sulfur modification protein DndE [Blastocatellia bacterium]